MSEFTFLFRGREPFRAAEVQQQTMQKWAAWFKELGAKGHLKDPGRPLEPTGRLVRSGANGITDGPYAETKDVIGGYIVVEADNLDDAARLAHGCPILEAGGCVEVRQVQIFTL